jgi:hypothetical protein
MAPKKKTPRPAKKKAASGPRGSSRSARKTAGTAGSMPRRADFGAPIDGFVAKQPPHLREILETLRGLIEEAAPEVQSSLKWGMPFYSIGGKMMCGTPAHKAHVNLILAGPAEAFDDPEGRLAGESKMGRHLKLTSLDDLPARAVLRRWLRAAAQTARKAGK